MANTTAAAAPKQPIFDVTNAQSQMRGLVDSSYAWFGTHWLQILVAVGIASVIVIGLHFLRSLGNRLCRRDRTGNGWWTIAGRVIVKTGNFFIVMVAAKLVSGYANPPSAVATTISFLFTIAAVFQAAIWARELILGAIEHRTSAGHGEAVGSAMNIIRLLVTFALFAIALIVVLDNLGVNVTGLVAGLGVGGIAIGLAAQGIFADLFAALAIIFDRPFRRGDAITYDKSSGTVEAIGLKSTRVRAATGEERIIANRNLLDKEIINNTQREYRRIIFTLGLVQSTSVEQMRALPQMMKEVIEGCEGRFVRAGFTGFGASSYDFDVEFDSSGPAFQDAFDRRHTIGLAIIDRLNREKMSLAYPTQTAISASEAGLAVGADTTPLPAVNASPPATVAPTSGGDRSAVDQDHAG